MPFSGGPDTTVPVSVAVSGTDTPLPFTATLATAGTAQDFVTVPADKVCRSISLVNLGPGSAFILPDADAAAGVTSIEVKAKEAYSEDNLIVETRFSFVGEAGKKPQIRGVAWAGTY